ncbi:tRNA (uracil-5-)-methyltransferase homolog A isoform X2 [Anabrus simplex]
MDADIALDGKSGMEVDPEVAGGSLEASNTADNDKTACVDNPTNDPYAYLGRGDFTSEKFKIEVRGLPKFYGIGEFKKLINEKLKLGSNKVKPPRRGSYWAYVCFRSEEDRQKALTALNGFMWKSKKLSASIAQPAPDPWVKKRKQEEGKGNLPSKKISISKEDQRPQEERLKDSTIPLWNIPYDDQMKGKQEKMRELLRKLGHDMLKHNPALRGWLEEQKNKNDDLPCQLGDIRSAGVCEGYRNKCEFSVGMNEETGTRTVGFRLGSYVDGFVGVAPVDCLLHVPQRMKDVARVFEKLVRASNWNVFHPVTQEGVWRQLTVRLAAGTGDLMLVVGVNSRSLTSEQSDNLKSEVRDFFSSGEGAACGVTSLYFQNIIKRQAGGEMPPLEHLSGNTHITEVLLGLKFRISPEAFFQTNTAAAEVLYKTIEELAALDERTALLDLYCGTGSIGLTLAKKCGQVLGLEISEKAVADAKLNTVANNITNAEFYQGRMEDIVTCLINRVGEKEVLAVVDPPRAGLHFRAVHHLRNALNLHKLIFVSCEPKAAMENLLQLCRPASKTYKGAPFVPIRAVPVDLFPHTAHCELVVYLERLHS